MPNVPPRLDISKGISNGHWMNLCPDATTGRKPDSRTQDGGIWRVEEALVLETTSQNEVPDIHSNVIPGAPLLSYPCVAKLSSCLLVSGAVVSSSIAEFAHLFELFCKFQPNLTCSSATVVQISCLDGFIWLCDSSGIRNYLFRVNCGSTLCQVEREVVASDSSLAEEPSPVQIVWNIYYSGFRLILNWVVKKCSLFCRFFSILIGYGK
jgi:hypothetical protein